MCLYSTAPLTLQAQAVAVWQQQQQMQGGLFFGGMHAMAGGHPMHHPQLYGLSPQMQMVPPQMQMPPQHHQYQQHYQHHHVGRSHGQSPLQPAQSGAPPLHASVLPAMQARRM